MADVRGPPATYSEAVPSASDNYGRPGDMEEQAAVARGAAAPRHTRRVHDTAESRDVNGTGGMRVLIAPADAMAGVLAPLRHPHLMLPAIAQALGLADTGDCSSYPKA